MPKKKTGQRKKAEKQRLRQKEIRTEKRDLGKFPSNAIMVNLILYLEIYNLYISFPVERKTEMSLKKCIFFSFTGM